jgi:ribose 1,5-bisphosphokinase PhnN
MPRDREQEALTVSRTPPPPAVAVTFDASALRPLIAEVVREVLAQVEADRAKLPEGRLCYSEPEAAALLGVEPHVLSDERRRGRITASKIMGRRIRYLREDLVAYLRGRRTDWEGAR